MVSKVKVDKDAEMTPDVVRELAKSIVSKMGPKYTSEQKKEHAKLLIKIFEKGIDPQTAMKLTEQDIAEIYLFAYRLFGSGRYEEAVEVFKMLTLLVPNQAGFAIALGACYHKMNKYEEAVKSYIVAALTDTTNPEPYFYAYDCYLQLKDTVSAGIMLSNAVAKCGDNPVYAKLKVRGAMLLENITKEITEKQKK